jgi:predicted dehydrogenase
VKIGILGTGRVASGSYLPYLTTCEDVELFYHNRTKEKARACAEQFGGTVCDDLEELVTRASDAVLVLTAETVRGDVLRQLIPLRPARLFLEKPLVARNGQDKVTEEDFREGREIMRELHANGCQTAMIFNYRFFDQVLAIKSVLAARDFGKPLNASAFVNYACWSHCIDLLLHFVGPVDCVTAQAGAMIHRHDAAEARDLTATLSFRNGAAGTLIGTWSLDFAFPLFELVLNYEGGRFHFRGLDEGLEVLDYSTRQHENLRIPADGSRWDQYNASFGKSLEAYLASLRRDSPPPIPGMAGLLELQVEAGLRRAIREQRPVHLSDEFPIQEENGRAEGA